MIPVSSLSAYEYCKRKLFIEKVLGIRAEIPEEALIKGSIRHSIYEKINRAEESIVKSIDKKDFEIVMQRYKEACTKILKKEIISKKERLRSIELPLVKFFAELKPLIDFEAEFRAEKIFQFMSKNDFLGEELWENLTPKIKPEYRLSSEKLGLRGIIDELEVYNHFFVPVELKTGKAPDEGVWPGHKIQVAAYAMMLEDFFWVSVEKGIVRYLDTNTSRNVIINPFLRQEVNELAGKVKKLLSSAEIPEFTSNTNKCGSCSLKEACFDEKTLNNALNKKTKDLNRT